MSEKIFLVDQSTDFSKCIAIFRRENCKIITFDYKSHKILKKEKVNHVISETFLDNEKLEQIQLEVLKLSEWYNHDLIKEILIYDGIQIGELFRSEFHNFLIPFIKKVYEINQIKIRFEDSNIICSSNIFEIANEIFKNPSRLETGGIYNKLEDDEIQYNVFNKIDIKISKENFQKLKRFSEIALKKFLKTNEVKNYEKTGAFVEFDTIKFESLFQNVSKFPLKIFSYNRRRPSIWNKKTFSIVKNSNIIPYSDHNYELKEGDLDDAKKIYTDILNIFDNLSFLQEYFIFDGQSFGKSLRPYLLKILERKISDAIKEIKMAKEFISSSKLSFIVILSESGFTEQIMMKLARRNNIQVILLQHGLFFYSDDAIEYNKLAGVLPQFSDKFFAWGNNPKKYAVSTGFPKEKIFEIGNMNLERKFMKKKETFTKKKVLLLATGPKNQHHTGVNVRELERFEDIVYDISKIVTSLGCELIIKRHSDPSEHELPKEIEKEFQDIKILKNVDPLPLQFTSDVVISLGITTGILEAQLFKKPVILFHVDYEMFSIPDNISNGCINTTIESFEKDLKELLTNTEFYKDQIKAGQIALTRNLSNISETADIFLNTVMDKI
tara:strand:- start:1461 stop:3290 length:1830 start_codon:yes stop_codon:yes gene_type:complete